MRATDKAVMGSLAVMSEQPQHEPQHQPATRAITSGRAASGTSLAPALWASSVWQSTGMVDARRRATGVRCDEFYSRYSNPTVRSFEDAVADLEGAEASLAFASGMGAITSVVLALCSKGDHIVAQRNLYSATLAFLQGPCARFGIDTTFVDATQPGAFRAAIQPGRTMLVIAETPSNPRLELADLDELGSLGGPIVVVDSTFATPMCAQPLRHGATVVMHSGTKFIGGHSDLLMGLTVTNDADVHERLNNARLVNGCTPGALESFLALRGLRTLPLRMERAQANAVDLVARLRAHPQVEEVRYPGTGAMASFVMRGGAAAADAVCAAVQLVVPATSLGGVETTIERRQKYAGDAHVPPGLIRMSVGIEHVDDIWADLQQAIDSTVSR